MSAKENDLTNQSCSFCGVTRACVGGPTVAICQICVDGFLASERASWGALRRALRSGEALVVLDLADRCWGSLAAGGVPISDCSESLQNVAYLLSSETIFSERAEVPPAVASDDLLSQLARSRPSRDESAAFLARMAALGIEMSC